MQEAPGNGPDYSASFAAASILNQIDAAKALLERAGPNATVTLGNPADVLSPVGNISDIALTNLLWLVDLLQGKAVELPEGQRLPDWALTSPPGSAEEAVAFLDRFRTTDTPEQAIARLEAINTVIATCLKETSFADDAQPIAMTFYGEQLPYHIVTAIIEHGFLHLGQADGTLKSRAAGAQPWTASAQAANT